MKQDAYGPFPYSAMPSRPKVAWPNGARLAVWVIPNIEFFALNEPIPGESTPTPNVPSWALRDYGNRIGVFRMADAMTRFGIRGTVALNADLCDHHPEILSMAVERGWEFMGHNESNSRPLNAVPAEDERRVILETLSRIEAATGQRPRGWLGSGLQETWNTLDYLIEGGITYVADWVNDDQPYTMTLGDKRIHSIPYSLELNDRRVFGRQNQPAAIFEQMIRDQFDILYREGKDTARVMAICLHPYLVGVPHRIAALERAFAHVAAHEGVWFATGGEIIDAWIQATAGNAR